jgi:hypothetical protein
VVFSLLPHLGGRCRLLGVRCHRQSPFKRARLNRGVFVKVAKVSVSETWRSELRNSRPLVWAALAGAGESGWPGGIGVRLMARARVSDPPFPAIIRGRFAQHPSSICPPAPIVLEQLAFPKSADNARQGRFLVRRARAEGRIYYLWCKPFFWAADFLGAAGCAGAHDHDETRFHRVPDAVRHARKGPMSPFLPKGNKAVRCQVLFTEASELHKMAAAATPTRTYAYDGASIPAAEACPRWRSLFALSHLWHCHDCDPCRTHPPPPNPWTP